MNDIYVACDPGRPVFICCNYVILEGPLLAGPISTVLSGTFQSRATPLNDHSSNVLQYSI